MRHFQDRLLSTEIEYAMMIDSTGVDMQRESVGVQDINSRYHLPSIQSERTVVPLYNSSRSNAAKNTLQQSIFAHNNERVRLVYFNYI